ncbi:fimbrial protein [Erwinia aphidicola]|uniref:fimbrial protein n=1 Tax=Erwinia aphidicola TaxID=68334 RepID=UPI003016FD56
MSGYRQWLWAIMLAASGAVAADNSNGFGKINMRGVVIDAPCSLAPESASLEVDFGQLSSAALRNGRESQSEEFVLVLQRCSSMLKNQVRVTFQGTAYSDGLFAVGSGNESIGLVLRDRNGQSVLNNQPVAWQRINDGDNKLVFSAAVKGRAATIDTGTFQAQVLFLIEYN